MRSDDRQDDLTDRHIAALTGVAKAQQSRPEHVHINLEETRA